MKKILVIDDDTSFLESLSSYLIEAGFTVLSAENAISGLDIIRNIIPDLVISDIKMPGLSGIELAYVLKGFKCDIPLILISAYCEDENVNNKFLCYAYLEKPIDIHKLNHYINQAIN